MPQDKKLYKFVAALRQDRIKASATFWVLMQTENGKPVREIENDIPKTEKNVTRIKTFNAGFVRLDDEKVCTLS